MHIDVTEERVQSKMNIMLGAFERQAVKASPLHCLYSRGSIILNPN